MEEVGVRQEVIERGYTLLIKHVFCKFGGKQIDLNQHRLIRLIMTADRTSGVLWYMFYLT